MTISAPAVTIEVDGLKAFRRALLEVDREFVKELGREYKVIGNMVVADAASRARGLGGVAAKAADAVKATAQTTAATIKLAAGDRYPYAYGAEFGGGRKPTTRQFKPWLGSGANAGYFLYPTIRADAQKIMDAFTEATDRVTSHAFPNR